MLEGATLVVAPAGRPYVVHPGPSTVDAPCRIGPPASRRARAEARGRRTILREARSRENRPPLQAELERRRREASR